MNRQEEMPPAPRPASAPIASAITTPLKKGNCFSCGKPGHWVPECPRPASAPIASAITTPLKKGNCFSCGKPGHWVSECPNKRSTGSFSQPILNTSRVASPDYSQVICRCGAGVCEPRIAKSDGNVYYTCPAKSWMRCDFFMKHSKLNSGGVRRLEYPICGCGAGVCILGREAVTDREYFKCRVPKGQGACSFKQWVDEPVSYTKSKSVTVEETDYLRTHQRLGKRVNHPFSEEDDPRRKSLRITEMDGSPNANTRRFSSNTLTSFVSSDTKAGSSLMSTMELDDISPVLMREIMEYDCPLSEDDESSWKSRIRGNMISLSPSAQLSLYSAVSLGSSNTKDIPAQVEVMALGSTITNVDQRADLSYGSQMEEVVNTAPEKLPDHVRQLQANFERRIVAAASDHSQGKCISAKLGAQYLGWLSRIAFASPRCSILPHDQNIFPNFDPINVRQSFLEDVPAINLKEPSAPGSPTYIGEPDNVIAAAILKEFGQAAMLIQTNFITRLESMNRSSHESMTKEANTFFASLDHLKVDYRPFHQRVKDFINAAASLNQIENSISNDALFQDTLDRLNKEKLSLGQLSSEYSSEMKSFTCSQEIVLSLINEAEEVRNRHLRIEQQVSACQRETNDLNTRLGELSDQISECQNLLSTSLEAEAAHKLFLQKQAELSSARNTFEKAKFQLRDKDSAFPKSICKLCKYLLYTPLECVKYFSSKILKVLSHLGMTAESDC